VTGGRLTPGQLSFCAPWSVLLRHVRGGSWPLLVLLIGDDLLSNRDEADTLVGLR
jgi:hypothetical protein